MGTIDVGKRGERWQKPCWRWNLKTYAVRRLHCTTLNILASVASVVLERVGSAQPKRRLSSLVLWTWTCLTSHDHVFSLNFADKQQPWQAGSLVCSICAGFGWETQVQCQWSVSSSFPCALQVCDVTPRDWCGCWEQWQETDSPPLTLPKGAILPADADYHAYASLRSLEVSTLLLTEACVWEHTAIRVQENTVSLTQGDRMPTAFLGCLGWCANRRSSFILLLVCIPNFLVLELENLGEMRE